MTRSPRRKYVRVAFRGTDGLNVVVKDQFPSIPETIQEGRSEAIDMAVRNGYTLERMYLYVVNQMMDGGDWIYVFPIRRSKESGK